MLSCDCMWLRWLQMFGDPSGQCSPPASPTVVVCGDQDELGALEKASIAGLSVNVLPRASPSRDLSLHCPLMDTQAPGCSLRVSPPLWLWVWSPQLSPHSSTLPLEDMCPFKAPWSLSRPQCKHLRSASTQPSCSFPAPVPSQP